MQGKCRYQHFAWYTENVGVYSWDGLQHFKMARKQILRSVYITFNKDAPQTHYIFYKRVYCIYYGGSQHKKFYQVVRKKKTNLKLLSCHLYYFSLILRLPKLINKYSMPHIQSRECPLKAANWYPQIVCLKGDLSLGSWLQAAAPLTAAGLRPTSALM